MMSPFGYSSPYMQQNPYMMFGGGMLGGYGGMGGYGGISGFNPYSGGMGSFGGYNPYIMQNPWGSSMGMPQWGSFDPGFMDQFEARLQDMFSKYFPSGTSTTATPSTTDTTASSGDSTTATDSGERQKSPIIRSDIQDAKTEGPSLNVNKAAAQMNRPENLGKKYLNTGEFGQAGKDYYTSLGYKSQEDYLANDPEGQRLANRYLGNAANVSPRGAGGRGAPRTR